VRNIYKYRAAGGIYRKKEDFARLYGLTVKEYRELEPYIHISADYLPAATLVKEEAAAQPRDTLRYPVKLTEGETVDLSTCDTTQLRRVPGIGSYFARRIVQYRSQLGGFVSLSQLDEIEGFPQDAKAYLTIGSAPPHKLNLNKLSIDELKRHPYLNFYQARDIVDYRRRHGPLHSLQDLSLLRDFPPEVISRLQPYVEF
jgi:DNA uptake protein ComE-like DNA-binding protein